MLKTLPEANRSGFNVLFFELDAKITATQQPLRIMQHLLQVQQQ